MSIDFKKVLATVSLVVLIPFSILIYLGSMMSAAWGPNCDLGCNVMRSFGFVGPYILFVYIRFLKTKSDLYFWLTVVPFLLLVIYMAVAHFVNFI